MPGYEGVEESRVLHSVKVETERVIIGELKKGLWPSMGIPVVGGTDAGPFATAAAAAATAIERARDA